MDQVLYASTLRIIIIISSSIVKTTKSFQRSRCCAKHFMGHDEYVIFKSLSTQMPFLVGQNPHYMSLVVGRAPPLTGEAEEARYSLHLFLGS